MFLDAFDFQLPPHLVADRPANPRDSSRLLVVDKVTTEWKHHRFFEIDQILQAGDVLVLNRSKVFKARLFGYSDTRKFEIFLLRRLENGLWKCLVRPGKRIRGTLKLKFSTEVRGTITRDSNGFFYAEFDGVSGPDFYTWLGLHGEVPLPPYIRRVPDASDSVSYQTVYASHLGSVAAPTAGLHFTETLLEKLKSKGVFIEMITLHVGYGTFAPISVRRIEEHRLHAEEYEISPSCEQTFQLAKKERRRIIAVGTTTLRAIESIPTYGIRGSTELFIRPGFEFHWVDGLITNFHLPKSSLFVLVSAFLGIEAAHRCYAEAIRQQYRFFSYGDAMAILP